MCDSNNNHTNQGASTSIKLSAIQHFNHASNGTSQWERKQSFADSCMYSQAPNSSFSSSGRVDKSSMASPSPAGSHTITSSKDMELQDDGTGDEMTSFRQTACHPGVALHRHTASRKIAPDSPDQNKPNAPFDHHVPNNNTSCATTTVSSSSSSSSNGTVRSQSAELSMPILTPTTTPAHIHDGVTEKERRDQAGQSTGDYDGGRNSCAHDNTVHCLPSVSPDTPPSNSFVPVSSEKTSCSAKEIISPSASCPAEITKGKKNKPTSKAAQKRKKSSPKPQKDRSKLRKGKWTREEEEYTNRIIHYFNMGILTQPEGSTLRSYLADKLNCDPMRITKKYAANSCLGKKRAYHLCPSEQDVQNAKAELARLEQRFRLRIEHNQTGIPLTPQSFGGNEGSDVRSNILTPNPPFTQIPTSPPNMATPSSAWLHNFETTQSGTAPAPSATPTPQMIFPTLSLAQQQIQSGKVLAPWGTSTAGQGNLPAWISQQAHALGTNGTNPAMQQSLSPTQEMIASIAWAQAVASLTPALSQLAAMNIRQYQQQQLQALQQQQQENAHIPNQPNSPAPVPAPSAVLPFSTDQAPPTHTLQQQHTNYSQYEQDGSCRPHVHTHSGSRPASTADSQSVAQQDSPSVDNVSQASFKTKQSEATTLRSKEDQDAGNMLMGFISTLREGYLAAKEDGKRLEPKHVAKKSSSAKSKKNAIGKPGHSMPRSKDSSMKKKPKAMTVQHQCDTVSSFSMGSRLVTSTESSDEAKTDASSRTVSNSPGDMESSSLSSENNIGREPDRSSVEDGEGSRGNVSFVDSSDDNRTYESGPPKKRKRKAHIGRFTSRNIADHNSRIEAQDASALEKLLGGRNVVANGVSPDSSDNSDQYNR